MGVREFVSGGAQGIDQLACLAVDAVKRRGADVRNRVFVPFAAQPSRWSRYGIFSQAYYRDCLDRADEVRIVAKDPAGNDYGAVVAALHGRNHVMVAESDLVIAFLADRALDWRNSKGGTAECVRYAHGKGKPILAIEYRPGEADPFTLSFIAS